MGHFLQLITVVILMFTLLDRSEGSFCAPCDNKRCENSPTDCIHGYVLDACDCCRVCAKGPGESCGGISEVMGRCGRGFRCISRGHRSGKCSYGGQ